MANLVVTITPPTPNGDLHIGHIAGPFMSADVYARVQRQRGHQCVLVSYSDDYQSYMLRRGLELGRDPVELAKSNTAKIRGTLASVGIAVDQWMEPYRNPYFEQAVREIYGAASDAGLITQRESLEPYCPSCKVWGYEAFGRGNCNYCGSDSDASQCECCAMAPEASKMTDFRCKLCSGPHQWLPVQRAFLNLADGAPRLLEQLGRLRLRKPLDSWIRDTLAQDLPDWGVTRPGDAGLDLAADGSCRIHTWFMGLAGYLAAFREYADGQGRLAQMTQQFWHSPDSQLVHFLGFDCAYSHMVVYPTLLNALPQVQARPMFYPNQFLKLEGLNLSTSRNHAIWARDLVAQACSDSVRLYLASVAPEESEGDFVLAAFQQWRGEIFGDFAGALLAAAAREPGSWSDDAEGDGGAIVQGLRRRWLAATSLDQFSMRQLAQVVLDTIALIRPRLASGRPVAHLAAFLAVAGQALHPALSARIVQAFGIDEEAARRFLVAGEQVEYEI